MTSTAHPVPHPTMYHLCSYSNDSLTFGMWRLFADSKESLFAYHLPSETFHLSNHPVGQKEPPKKYLQRHGHTRTWSFECTSGTK